MQLQEALKFHLCLGATMLHFTTLNKEYSFYRKFQTSGEFIAKETVKNILILIVLLKYSN